jgi:hypothetical protein
MAKHRIVGEAGFKLAPGVLLLFALFVTGCGLTNVVQPPPTTAPTAVPEYGSTTLVPYNDPNGAFSILMPPGWQVQQEPTSPLVKVSTLIGGPQGHIAVLQLDTHQLPAQNTDQLVAAILTLMGASAQPNYHEVGRTKLGDNWVQIEATFTRDENRPSHSVTLIRVEDESLTSLWMVVLDEAVWEPSVPAVRAILNSYQPATAGKNS